MMTNELMSPSEAADSIMENQIPCKECINGKVTLFTSVTTCKVCGGTGFITIKTELPKTEPDPNNMWGNGYFRNCSPENYID